MKHTVEKLSPSQVKIVVEVDVPVWAAAQAKAFDKVSQKVSVPGFRPGKAPKELLKEKVNPEAVFNEAIEQVLTPVYAEVIGEEKINPFFRPEIAITKMSDAELEIVYTVTLVPEVTLGAYQGLKAVKETPVVTDAEVQGAIENLLKGNASLVLVDRPAKLGDTVTLDFDGYTADEKGAWQPFDGGKADNYSLELGSHQFIPGFEEAAVGLKSGDKKDLKVTFPTNYVKELAGKEATFKILIHEVKEKQIPTLTDAAVSDLKIKDVDTVAKLQDYEKATLLKDKIQKAEDAYYNAILGQIVGASTFVIDQTIIANEATSMENNLKKQVEQQGLTFDQYLQITGGKEEDLKKTYLAEAEKNLKAFLASNKIAEAEKLTVTDADVEAEIKKIADQYKMKEEEVRSILAKNLEEWKNNLLQKKIHDFIVASNA
jgi:trigger factor